MKAIDQNYFNGDIIRRLNPGNCCSWPSVQLLIPTHNLKKQILKYTNFIFCFIQIWRIVFTPRKYRITVSKNRALWRLTDDEWLEMDDVIKTWRNYLMKHFIFTTLLEMLLRLTNQGRWLVWMMQYVWERLEIHAKFQLENLKRRVHLET